MTFISMNSTCSAFTSAEVKYVDKDANYDYPYEGKNDLLVKLSVQFSNAVVNVAGVANNTQYVLNKVALESEFYHCIAFRYAFPL